MFSEQQLEHIKAIARKKKNQGELSVYLEIDNGEHMGCLACCSFSEVQANIIKYCAEECKRQHSGELSVYDMINAWNWAYEHYHHLMIEGNVPDLMLQNIETLGQLVEPIDNKNGFRTIPIGVTDGYGGWIEKAKWDRVPFMLEMLLDSYYTGMLATDALDAANGDPHYRGWHKLSQTAEDQFYYEYENIHPFRDGNGRSGKILYNYLLGALDAPILPPNFWNSSNP
jgi:hypothetical protein